MTKTKIVHTSFNSHNKISYIKNFMHVYILLETPYQKLSH